MNPQKIFPKAMDKNCLWKKNLSGKWQPDTTFFANLSFDEARLRYNDDPFFADVEGDGDLDMLIGTDAQFRQAGVRYFENVGNAREPIWREDSTRLVEIYQNPSGYSTLSPILMHANADTLLDLTLVNVIEGLINVVFYPGVRDSLGMRWSGVYEWLPVGFNGTKLLPLHFDSDGREDLLILGSTSRVHLRSKTTTPYFDPSYFSIGPISPGNTSAVIPFDINQDGQNDLLTIGHFEAFISNLTYFQSYQRQKLAGMTLWRDIQWFQTNVGFGDVREFKAQLVDIDRNGHPDFVAASPPYYLVPFENPSPDSQQVWQPRGDLLIPFINAGQQTVTIYYDPSFADLDGDNDPDLLITESP
jgi:hypothetical protein